MSISTTISSPDIERQIELLKYYPEIVKKRFKPALQSSVMLLDAAIRPAIPVGEKTPHAKDLFRSKVLGTGISNMRGEAGWNSTEYPWYINVVEHGARAHDLTGGALNASSAGGTPVKVKGAGWRTMKVHPGFGAVHFLRKGFQAVLPAIQSLMQAANEACVQDLKVN
jgi:hypothetical protein